MTPEKLRASMTRPQYKIFSNTFKRWLTDDQRKQYAALDMVQKASWVCQWSIDPALCQSVGYNKAFAYSDDSIREEDRWLTEEQLVDYSKSRPHARAVIAGKELRERPSKFKALAAMGICEYYITDEMHIRMKGKREEKGVRAVAELKPNEFAEVADSIRNAAVTHKIKRGGQQAKKTIDPSQKDAYGVT